MTAVESMRWAETVGAAEIGDAPPLPEAAADLLRRLDFPIPPAAGVSRLLPPQDSPEAA